MLNLVRYKEGGFTDPKWRDLWAGAEMAVNVTPSTIQQYDHSRKVLGLPFNTITTRIDRFLGPSIEAAGGSTHAVQFANGPTSLGTAYTFAALAVHDANSAFDQLIGTSLGNNALRFTISNLGNTLNFTKGGVAAKDSSIVVNAGEPFFLSVSHDEVSGVYNFLTRNLRTGAILTATPAVNTSSSTAGDGIFSILNARTVGLTNASWDGACSMAFVSRGFKSMDFLRQWSRDPRGPFEEVTQVYWTAEGAPPAGRIMSSLAGSGGLAHKGGIAGAGGGLAG